MQTTETSDPPAAAVPSHETGRERFTANVIWSWAGHSVFIVTGFIMPRYIDARLGQASLGMWDFGWSIVSYFGVADIGIGSSVNRYVAKYRTLKDSEALSRTVSTVNRFQTLSAAVMMLVTAALVWRLPIMFGARLQGHFADARYVLGFLGTAIAAQSAFDVYRGVLTGCHRWDLHNGLNAGSQLVSTIAMIAAVFLGGGLPAMAAVYCACVILTELVRKLIVHRVCPELVVSRRYVAMSEMRTLVTFGGKTLVDGISKLVLFQANNIMVVGTLGVTTLAVYARAMALIRHAEVVTSKLAYVVTPAASSLKSKGREEDLRELLLSSTRYGAFVAIPIIAFLAVLGDAVIRLWMGPGYADGWALPILAAGMLMPLLMRPAQHVLIGINKHGRVGLATLALAIAGIAAGYVLTGPMQLGLIGASLSLAVPLTIGNGIFLCIYAARTLHLPIRTYLASLRDPAACGVLFTAVLLLVRFGTSLNALPTVLLGMSLGGGVLVPCYWRYALPRPLKQRLRERIALKTRAPAAA